MEKDYNLVHFLRFWLPVILWGTVVFMFSTLPMRPTNIFYWQDFIIKKTAHMVEYFILTTLNYRAFINTGFSKKQAAMIALTFSVFYGFTDEFHQRFTPGREPKLRDVGFDTIGAGFAIYFIWKLLPRVPKRLGNLAENFQLQ